MPLRAQHKVFETYVRNASILAGRRVVFNIKGNEYRLVAALAYNTGVVFVKFGILQRVGRVSDSVTRLFRGGEGCPKFLRQFVQDLRSKGLKPGRIGSHSVVADLIDHTLCNAHRPAKPQAKMLQSG